MTAERSDPSRLPKRARRPIRASRGSGSTRCMLMVHPLRELIRYLPVLLIALVAGRGGR